MGKMVKYEMTINSAKKRILIIICAIVLLLPVLFIYADNAAPFTNDDIYSKKIHPALILSLRAEIADIDGTPSFVDISFIDLTEPRFYVSKWLYEPISDIYITDDGQYITGRVDVELATHLGFTKQLRLNRQLHTVDFSISIDEYLTEEKGLGYMNSFETIAVVINALLLTFAIAITVLFYILSSKTKASSAFMLTKKQTKGSLLLSINMLFSN